MDSPKIISMLTYMARKYKKKTKRRYKKRTSRPRKSLVLSGFPSKKLVRLRYVDTSVTLNSTSIATDSAVFRANSAFDPDFTNAGSNHQPMGYDQWSVIYNKYTVLNSTISVSFAPTSVSNVIPGYLGVTLGTESDPLSNFSTIDNILESKLTAGYRIVGAYPVTNSGLTRPIRKIFNTKRFFGKVNAVDGQALSALVTTNPSEVAYYSIWMASIDGNDPGAVSLHIKIDYDVMFHEPKSLDGS